MSIFELASLLCVWNQRLHLQAHEFLSDAEEAAEDAADAVKDEANRATSSGPHMARPLGKDPIPTNTENIAKWRKAHPPPAKPIREAGSDTKQSAEGSWESAKGQTREAVDEAKGKSREAADDLKGKYRETAQDVKSKTQATAEDVKDKASDSADGWASWFGEFPWHCFCCGQCHIKCVLPVLHGVAVTRNGTYACHRVSLRRHAENWCENVVTLLAGDFSCHTCYGKLLHCCLPVCSK